MIEPIEEKGKYLLEIKLSGLPKSPNQLLGAHWRARAGHANLWERKVWRAVWSVKPTKPLLHATVTLTRASSGRMDADNCRGSFKCVVDALVKLEILSDDSRAVIGEPVVLHEKTSPRNGHIKVRVEEI